jgi:hypothetical protein
MRTQIRNNPGTSSYFQGGYSGYGKYQWNIKFYGFQNDAEIETAIHWAFGEYNLANHTFDGINDLIGRKVRAHIDGRSGGWLVVDSTLTEVELQKIDELVSASLKGLSEMLSEERKFWGRQ